MRITSKGQVTIPAHIRHAAGLTPNTDIDFEVDGTAVRIVRATSSEMRSHGARLVSTLRGTGDVPMTTDEIMALTRGESSYAP